MSSTHRSNNAVFRYLNNVVRSVQNSFRGISIFSTTNKKEQTSVKHVVLTELMEIKEECAIEQSKVFCNATVAKREKAKRLMQLFHKDLLPGVAGLILESKSNRDDVQAPKVSKSYKTVVWILLGCLNTGMLSYVFLFVLSEDSHRQSAWVQSFVLWLVFEIFLMSTLTALVFHVFLPSLITTEVAKIKQKLMDSVLQYHAQLGEAQQTNELANEQANDLAATAPHIVDPSLFNAAAFLFLSYRLASLHADMKVAQIILQFRTPWPRQSYQRVFDVSKSYSKRVSVLVRSISLVLLFVLTNLLSMPITLQDMIVHAISTTAIGYVGMFHIQLYKIFPVLVIVPSLFLLVVGHFLYSSWKAKEDNDRAELNRKNASIVRAIAKQRQRRHAIHESKRSDNEQKTTTEIQRAEALPATLDEEYISSSRKTSTIREPTRVSTRKLSFHHINRKQSVQLAFHVLENLKQEVQEDSTMHETEPVPKNDEDDPAQGYVDMRDRNDPVFIQDSHMELLKKFKDELGLSSDEEEEEEDSHNIPIEPYNNRHQETNNNEDDAHDFNLHLELPAIGNTSMMNKQTIDTSTRMEASRYSASQEDDSDSRQLLTNIIHSNTLRLQAFNRTQQLSTTALLDEDAAAEDELLPTTIENDDDNDDEQKVDPQHDDGSDNASMQSAHSVA